MLLPGPNGTSKAKPTQVPIMPATRNRRRRPLALRTRSESAPATGAMTSAINAPIARIEPLIPSFAAAFGPRIDDIWSGTMTGTTVSQLANSANHSNDTTIWSVTENRPDCGTARRAEARAPEPSPMSPPLPHSKDGQQHSAIPSIGENRLARRRRLGASFRTRDDGGAMTMKAVVCEAFGGPEVLALREVPDPPQPGPDEVQVRITARGVQYVDVLMLAGKYQFRPEPPFIPGNEGAGEVVAVGPRVAAFKPGDKVMCRQRLGAFAERGNVKAEDCDLVPAAMSLDEAAVFRNVYHTAYHALLQRGRLKAGDRVLIHGAAGGIGLPAIQIAKLYGADVIATASTDEKRAACLEEGADYAIPYHDGFRDRVMELTRNRGVDIVYDPVNGPTFEESLRCLAWSGRILILGFLGGAPAAARTNYLLIKGIEAIGVRIGGLSETHPDIALANIKTLIGLAAEGKLKPRIWRRYALENAAEAVQALIDRAVIGKAVLTG
jgi:NADPH2:quinone reductase